VPHALVPLVAFVLFAVCTPLDVLVHLLVWIWRALPYHHHHQHQHDTGDTTMTGTASTINTDTDTNTNDGRRGTPPLAAWSLLLASGQGTYNERIPADARTSAEAVFAHLLACAAAYGFRQADRLRVLCASDRHDTADAVALAHAAVDHVPADALRQALRRAGFPDALSGPASGPPA
jgi:hypothetical protein